MWIRSTCCRRQGAMVLAFAWLLATPAFGQTPESAPGTLESQVESVKAENVALREQLRKIEEQQRVLMELVRLSQPSPDGSTTPDGAQPVQPPGPGGTETALPVPVDAGSVPPQPIPQTQPMDHLDPRYNDGFVIVNTSDTSRFPFQLRLTDTTQFRYLNTTLIENETFTDHLGVVRPVAKRNDFSINRSMFTLGGFVFDKRLRFSLVTWTSNTLASVVVGGYISWEFNKAATVYAGYWTVPGSRTLSYTFPFFTQPDRSLADNFFRPGFTQGIWATGEPVKGLSYHVFVGNGLNTLTIPTNKIDTNLMFSGTTFWEPLGPYGPPGKARNLYDDYFDSEKPLVRIGTSFTTSREDRFSNLDQTNPENTSLHNSDGVLTFTTGAFAPGVTLEEADYRMWAIDGGVKWHGLAVNGQYYFRWLDKFVADGPLPLSSTFDNGGELSVSHFVVPKKLALHVRTSAVFGQFGDSDEFAGGFKWFFVPDHRVWLTGEVLRVNRSSFGGMIYPYTAGMTGWVPVGQLIFNF